MMVRLTDTRCAGMHPLDEVVEQYASIFILGLDCEHDVLVLVVPEFCRKVSAVQCSKV